jgi:hypothetical protein
MAANDNSLVTEWLCKFCSTWNNHFHRYCRRCLSQKIYAVKEER